MKNKIISITKNILGIFLGFYMTFSIGVAPGIFIMLSGLALLPLTFYEKQK